MPNDAPAAAVKLILAARIPGSIVAAKAALVRAGVELTSDKVGEVAPGSLVHILEERENVDGSRRAQFSLENDLRPHGWITSITSSGVQNLRTLSRPLVEATASKALQVRPHSPTAPIPHRT